MLTSIFPISAGNSGIQTTTATFYARASIITVDDNGLVRYSTFSSGEHPIVIGSVVQGSESGSIGWSGELTYLGGVEYRVDGPCVVASNN